MDVKFHNKIFSDVVLKKKIMKFYKKNPKFDYYKFGHMKWVLDQGSMLLLMTKSDFFSTKLLSILFIVKGRNDDSYPIRSEMV